MARVVCRRGGERPGAGVGRFSVSADGAHGALRVPRPGRQPAAGSPHGQGTLRSAGAIITDDVSHIFTAHFHSRIKSYIPCRRR